MTLTRVAVLLVLWGVVLSSPAQSQAPENAGSQQAAERQDDVPRSIAESVSGTLQFAEGNFLGIAEAMPDEKYSFVPTAASSTGFAVSGSR
jgi:hypothetical protein